jgi:hypothetical protein
MFLPDFEKLARKDTPAEKHVKVNSGLTFLSGIISLQLAIFLYLFYVGKESTPVIIYVILGFLTANFFWQAQTFWRMRLLKKHVSPKKNISEMPVEIEYAEKSNNSYSTDKLLSEPDFTNLASASVTEKNTNRLKQKR